MEGILSIKVTEKYGSGLYRARVNGSNVVSTCTSGPEGAVENALIRWDKGQKSKGAYTISKKGEDLAEPGGTHSWLFEATPKTEETEGTNGNGSSTPSRRGSGEPGSAGSTVVPEGPEKPVQDHCTNARALCGRANESSAMVAETSLVRQDLQVTLPESPDEYARLIRGFLDQERLGGLRAAVLIASQRKRMWPKKEQFQEWLDFSMKELGLARRSCFMYLKVGNFLTGQVVTDLPHDLQGKLVTCTIPKLEQLARLAAGQLTMVLTKKDPGGMAWDQVKDLVDGLLIPPAERLKSKEAKQLLEAQKKDPVFQIQSFSEMIERMAGGESLKRKAVIQRIDSSKALVGGVALAAIAVEAEENRHTIDGKDLAEAGAYLRKLAARVEALQKQGA